MNFIAKRLSTEGHLSRSIHRRSLKVGANHAYHIPLSRDEKTYFGGFFI